MSSWLAQQLKADLVKLAGEADLKINNSMKKDEVAKALDDHLRANETTLGKKKAFAQYYSHMGTKQHAASSSANTSAVETTKPKPSKRPTAVPAELESGLQAAQSAIQQVPNTLQNLASHVPLPSSPQAVTAMVDRSSEFVTTRFNSYVKKSGITSHLNSARIELSTVRGIQLVILGYELYALHSAIIPSRHAFNLPFPQFVANILSTKNYFSVDVPDFFVLLTSDYWAPMSLWFMSTIVFPVAVGWSFNLTRGQGVSRRHRYNVDPVAMSVAKALAICLIFVKGWRVGVAVGETGRVGGGVVGEGALTGNGGLILNGYVSAHTARMVEHTMFGGAAGMLVNAALCGLAGLYEAILTR